MIILDDDAALSTIQAVFGHSEPGAEIHSLVLVRKGLTALGVPELVTSMDAIAPAYDNALDAERFIDASIRSAAADPTQPQPLLAVFVMEAVSISEDVLADEVQENNARLLLAAGRLRQHSQAVELSRLYAAAADGRRWTGQHWLTGPQAGEIEGPTQWDRGTRGPLDGWIFGRVVRAAVGLRW
jgi:hypothetical protein